MNLEDEERDVVMETKRNRPATENHLACEHAVVHHKPAIALPINAVSVKSRHCHSN